MKYRCKNCGRIFSGLEESISVGQCCEKKNVEFYHEEKKPEIVDVKKIITDYLKQNGFDGLCNVDCGCGAGDMGICGNLNEECVPAYLHENPNSCPSDCNIGCFLIEVYHGENDVELIDMDEDCYEPIYCSHPVKRPPC